MWGSNNSNLISELIVTVWEQEFELAGDSSMKMAGQYLSITKLKRCYEESR